MTDSSTVVVMARWKTTEVNRRAVLELWAALRAQSIVEPGCLGYEVFEQVGEPGTLLLLVERYRNPEAAAAHRNSSHYRELIERIRPLLDARSVEFLGLRDP
jgi:quinol monooxygenase YgiN